MDRADLDTALGFVIGRIEEEATRSGEPLSGEQRFLLNHLPEDSVSPQPYAGDPEFPPVLVLRDTTCERLCALAKAAHRNDLRVNPTLALGWEFASAVSKLNRHPMSWLLHWARLKQRRPRWDRWLLIGAALLFILFGTALMLLIGNQPWTRFQWTGLGAGYVAISVVFYFVSRRIEEWQLKHTVESCRRGSTFLSH
jgi:hypothetical protein